MDVSRGDMLTQLWITNSAQVKIDVRLWEHPSISHGLSRIHPSSPRHPLALSLIQQTVDRWRSLDIAYVCLCRTFDAVKFLQPHPAPQLDYLTIGPMGKTILHADMPPSDPDLLSAALSSGLAVQPRVLRIDTFAICVPSPLFSSRLLELEVFSNTEVEMEAWHSILSSTPNLTSLKLWHTCSEDHPNSPLHSDILPNLRLDKLKRLSLSGLFASLTTLFSQSSIPTSSSPLPSLASLRLSSTTPRLVPLYVAYLSAAAPLLSDLSVSFPRQRRRVESWRKALPNFRSLERLTFFEMDIVIVFCLLKAELHEFPKPLSYIGLERMGVPSDSDWSFLEVNGHKPTLCIKELPGSEGAGREKWMRKGIAYGWDTAIIRATESTGFHSASSSDESEEETDSEEESSSCTLSESSKDHEDEEQEQDPGEERAPRKKHNYEEEDGTWSLASGDLEVINQPPLI
ncbi:hypothetical protein BDV93DRAFT_528325, partial [Ceratobasidium sp. AG-I]